MKQDLSIEMFKGRLKGYRYFQRQIVRLDEEIQECYNQLGASPHSPQFDSEPIHSPKNIDREYKLRDRIESLERNKARSQAEIDFCNQILGEMETPVREAVIAIYADKKTMQRQADKMYMSKSTLRDLINREIKKVLDDEI